MEISDTELTKHCIAESFLKIKSAFPDLLEGFYSVLADRIKSNEFTDDRLIKAVNHVIDNCKYSKPSVADFISVEYQKPIEEGYIDYDKLVKIWNNNCRNLAKVLVMTEDRKLAVNYLVMKYDKKMVIDVFKKVKVSHKLQNEDWAYSFDWVLKPDNFIRIYEGVYK